MMNCVILQPSYIPWRGYFHQIQKADVFVFYDDVPYDKRGWRNRNRIKGPNGSQWLTIPVFNKGTREKLTPINEINIKNESNWQRKHWNTVSQYYAKAPYFEKYASIIEPFYTKKYNFLADFTIDLTIALAKELDLGDTQFARSSTLDISGGQTDRLIAIVKSVGADHYISGPSARDYLEEDLFEAAGVKLDYMTYDYPPYKQQYPPFDPQVSILDLLFTCGPDAYRYIWSTNT